MREGCVHIYTGDGKGKTTAAAGLAARAAGQGQRVVFFQFLKNGLSGEVLALSQLGVQCFAPQTGKFVWEMDADERQACAEKQQETLQRAADLMHEADLMVLDEVVCALEAGMVQRQALEDMIKNRPAGLELVLTGRGADEALLALADYATEMRLLAHPYQRGLAARKGIEF